jgi:CubicO group peptidase (beta-lactamase class C family)
MTLYHLATHTSGLPRMPDNFAPADPTNPYVDYTVEQMYEFLSGAELTGKPGASAAYSNYGAGLLGHILALQAGSDYETLVRKRIAGPLEMTDTVITLTPELENRLAQGHDETLEPAANWDIPTLAGAGALRSTVDDMLLFLAANLGLTESPISDAMEDSHRRREEFGGRHFGLGWFIGQGYGRTIHWHAGETGGYRSFVGFDKERKKGVVVLSNSTNNISDIGFHLLVPEFALAKFSYAGAQRIPYKRYVTLSVGQSTVIHGARGACGEAPPDWEEVIRGLPLSLIGSYSDGGLGVRRSRSCGGPTPARAVKFTAEKAGSEQIVLYGDPINITVK